MEWDFTITPTAIIGLASLLSVWIIYFLNIKKDRKVIFMTSQKKSIFAMGVLKKLIWAAANFEKALSLAAQEHRLVPAPFAIFPSQYKKN